MLMFSKQDIDKYEVKLTGSLKELAKSLLFYAVLWLIAGALVTIILLPFFLTMFEKQ